MLPGGMSGMNQYMTGFPGGGMMNPPMMGGAMPNPGMPQNPYLGATQMGNFATAMPGGGIGPGMGIGMPPGPMAGQFGTNMGGYGAAGPSLYAANPMGGA